MVKTNYCFREFLLVLGGIKTRVMHLKIKGLIFSEIFSEINLRMFSHDIEKISASAFHLCG